MVIWWPFENSGNCGACRRNGAGSADPQLPSAVTLESSNTRFASDRRPGQKRLTPTTRGEILIVVKRGIRGVDRRVGRICGLLVLLLSGSFFALNHFWQPDQAVETPPPNKPLVSALGPTKAQERPPAIPARVDASDSTFSGDPKEAVDSLIASYSGNELVKKLNEAGLHFADAGVEAAKQFMLELPPGKVGEARHQDHGRWLRNPRGSGECRNGRVPQG